MSLRDRLVEAGAEASCLSHGRHELDANGMRWAELDEVTKGLWRREAEAALDAILDTLEAETADWTLSAHPLAAGEVYTLIAALRETETGET